MNTIEPELHRLPNEVLPTKYQLSLTPDLDLFIFNGTESIDIKISKATQKITINSIDLSISAVTLQLGNRLLTTTKIDLDEELETATFSFGEMIPAGIGKLNIEFSGVLNDQLRGFYRSEYTDINGAARFLATTQLEATDARRAFPCWDEPAVKATFQVTLVIPQELVAISNMPIEREEARGNTNVVSFAETPKMSTYLLAFIVGDFHSVEKHASDGTLIRVWTTRGKENQGEFALENAAKLLDYMNDYFGVPYPLPKLDHIAIPDFAAGAMENWGAITYRETALLYDKTKSAAATKQRILEVVAHEMAHMWFGDLVTMEWWDDLWLNESFATWMGDKSVDQLYPDWNIWTQFVSHDTNVGLSLDGLRNSHPIEANVKDPSDIRELFDAISYSKGGATLRMLEEFIGSAAFRDGLRAYIKKHQYGNAMTKDLWKALEHTSGKPITNIMHSWISQTGYPVVYAEIDRGSQTVNLSQRRFLYDNLQDNMPVDDVMWHIPLTFKQHGDSEVPSTLMSQATMQFHLDKDLPQGHWMKINANQSGFYRVHYSEHDWSILTDTIKNQLISPADRLGLQNDAYALSKAGYTAGSTFLSLSEAYRDETDAIVWEDFSSNLSAFERTIAEEQFLPQFRSFAKKLYSSIKQKIGWDATPDEGHLETLLRRTVLSHSGSFGDQEVLIEAQNRFKSYIEDPSSLHPDLKSVVYSLAAEQGDRSTYEIFWDLIKNADLHEEKVRLLSSVCQFSDKELLSETLDRALSPAVRSQDAVIIIVSVAGNKMGKHLAWNFIKNRWPELDRRYGRGGFAITRLVSVAGVFTTLEMADDVDNFFRENPAPSAKRTVQQALERIKLNNKWLELNRSSLNDWFSKYH